MVSILNYEGQNVMRQAKNVRQTVLLVVVGGCLSALITPGCSFGPSRVLPPEIDPSGAAAAAILEYDADGDGALSGTELDRVPAIKGKATLFKYDKDSDGTVTAAEISARIEEWKASMTGIGRPFQCTIMLDGKPLEGATVKFIPEAFLGPAVKGGSGKTSGRGTVRVRMSEADLPGDLKGVSGMQLGLFRVVVTHPTKTIASEFTDVSTTPLGEENAHDRRIRSPADVVLNVKSR